MTILQGVRQEYWDKPRKCYYSMVVILTYFFRYLHRTDRSVTKRFLFLNSLAIWCCHVGAWFSYSLIIYGMHQEEAGMLRILPLIVAFVSFGPVSTAIHWATVINPSYKATAMDEDKANDNLPELPDMYKKHLFMIWQILTVITRVVSLVLLCYVYSTHWFEVGDVTFLMMVPYLLLILAANLGLQYAMFGRSLLNALLSFLLPNGFRRASVSKAGRYIIANMSMNLILHLVLWLNMTFYCWECTKVLDQYFTKLSICFPVSVGLWMINLVLTLLVWRSSIRNSLENSSKDNYQARATTARAWTDKENALTTKF